LIASRYVKKPRLGLELETSLKSIKDKRFVAKTGGSVAELHQWLADFSEAVRSADYARGRELFAEDVVAFGTRAPLIRGIDSLVEDQWECIWDITRGFQYSFDQAEIGILQESAWVAVPWTSQGQDSAGRWYDRPGRATYILRRTEGRWLAIHSHHSLDPKSPQTE
jgi:ketosteroid isomerase-like protein